jgi:hypothetical protein
MKTIVTHVSPDVDAVSAVWMMHRFYPGFKDAEVAFISQGKTYQDQPVDSNPDIIHVDTGLGRYDHHQTSEDTCGAKRIFDDLRDREEIKEKFIEPLERMIAIINDIDHFREIFWHDPNSDIYDFAIVSIIEGMKVRIQDDHKTIQVGELIFDGILQTFFNKIKAEKEIQQGLIFQSKWGKSLAINSENDQITQLAQKAGFALVIRKSLKKGHLKIKLSPASQDTLEDLMPLIKKEDKNADWFYHASGHMVISGSTKSPTSIPTSMGLNKAVDIVKRA